jgi:hypothetical protein
MATYPEIFLVDKSDLHWIPIKPVDFNIYNERTNFIFAINFIVSGGQLRCNLVIHKILTHLRSTTPFNAPKSYVSQKEANQMAVII